MRRPAMPLMPYRLYALAWDGSAIDDERFRDIGRKIAIATLLLSVVVSLLPLPQPDPAVSIPVPPRLARLVLERQAPVAPPVAQQPKPEPEAEAPVDEQPAVRPERSRERPVPPSSTAVATTSGVPGSKGSGNGRVGKAGLLPFVDQLADLRDNRALTSITSGGTRYTGAVGNAPQVERALITSQAGVGSGGINTARYSRNTGGSGLGGRAITQVASGVAALGGGGSAGGGSAAEAGSGNGSGQRASRSREEIEMVFDQNKGAIYALYNRALRSNPSLQGKLVLKLTIEPSGRVSDVQIVSSDLNDEELEQKLLQRVRMFSFVAKDVPPVTTTKPIDFFPA